MGYILMDVIGEVSTHGLYTDGCHWEVSTHRLYTDGCHRGGEYSQVKKCWMSLGGEYL